MSSFLRTAILATSSLTALLSTTVWGQVMVVQQRTQNDKVSPDEAFSKVIQDAVVEAKHNFDDLKYLKGKQDVFRFPKEWRTDFKVGERSSCKLEERDAVSILDCLLDVGEKAVNDDSYLVNQLDALGYGTWRYEALPSLLRYEPFTTAAIFYQDFWKIAVVIRAFWKDRSHPYRVAVAIEKDYLDRGFGSKGTIGISSQIPPDPTILRMLSTDHGVVVADVDPNGPAAKAGIQAGDVILSTDYRPVWDTLDLVSRLDESLGSSIRVTFLRDAKENEVKIMVTENKAGETDSSSYLRGFEPKRK